MFTANEKSQFYQKLKDSVAKYALRVGYSWLGSSPHICFV